MQLKILGEAQAAFFFGIVICQAFNCFVCKHLRSYPYGLDMLQYQKKPLNELFINVFACV